MDEIRLVFGDLSGTLAGNPTLLDALTAVVGAFVFSQVLAWAYERTYRGLSYSTNVTHTLILSAMSAALIVLAMKHSLVAGLGLLAALSMIRFRTTLKAPKDLVYVMSAITLGTACGANALMPATVGCVAFTLVSLYLHAGSFASRARFDGVLRFRTASSQPVEPKLGELLTSYCRRFVLLNIGEVAQGERVEHAYQVKLRDEVDRHGLLGALRQEIAASDTRLLLQDAADEY